MSSLHTLSGTAAAATHSAVEDHVHRLVAAAFFVCVAAATLGIAGTFSPLVTGTATMAAPGAPYSVGVTLSYLQTCTGCAATLTASCASFPVGCVANQGGAAGGANSATLTAGLSFSIMAWLLELAALPALIATVAETTNSALASGALLRLPLLPASLALAAAAVVFRCVALGCGVNYAFAQLLGTGSTVGAAAVVGGFSYTAQSNAGLICSFIALGLAIIMLGLLLGARSHTLGAMAHPAKAAVIAHASQRLPAPATRTLDGLHV